MNCPKCHASMEEHRLNTLSGPVTIDRCSRCMGIWFDTGEAEKLKEKWMSEHIDAGSRKLGKSHNLIRDIDCPRCGKKMKPITDPVQPHIRYEACSDHGIYLDAGEFTDYKYETLMDLLRGFIARITA